MRTAPDPRRLSFVGRVVAALFTVAVVLAAALGLLSGLATAEAVLAAAEPGRAPVELGYAAAEVAPAARLLADGSAPETDVEIDVMAVDSARPGERVGFTILYTNTRTGAITGVVISCALSTGQSFDGEYRSTPTIPRPAFSQDGLRMMWQLPALPAGSAGKIWLDTDVNAEPEPSAEQAIQLVGASAEVSAVQPGVSGGEDSAVVRIVGPILTLNKTDSPDPVTAGYGLTYELTIANLDRRDAIPATGIVITDVMPEHASLLTVSDHGHYDPEAEAVVWQLPKPLLPGTNQVVSFTVAVDPGTPSGTTITNDREDYTARSAELQRSTVTGKQRVNTKVQGLLDKSAETPRKWFGNLAAYPADIVTYTLIVRNYLNEPMAGVRVTDTLGGRPDPFEFVRATDGGPAPRVVDRGLVWTLDLPPRGEARRTYIAQVPRTISFSPNSTDGDAYASDLAAVHPKAVFAPVNGLASVRVMPPVIMQASVTPGSVQAGSEVTYTISFSSKASYPVRGIRFTNTFESPLFHYTGMVEGPAPEPGRDGNPVVWVGLEVPAGGETSFSFVAYADGLPLRTYNSRLDAKSPDVSIPARTGRATVRIASPFLVSKTVDPKTVVIGDRVHYEVELTSVATTTWTMTRFEDKLPRGIYNVESGQGTMVTTFDPPFELEPGGRWQIGYDAAVTNEVPCPGLPRTFSTQSGDIRLTFIAPIEAVFGNAGSLAPLEIQPHVRATLNAARRVVFINAPVAYDLGLENRSTEPIPGIGLMASLPPEFHYEASLRGPVPETNGNDLQWYGIELAPQATWQGRFLMRAGTVLGSRAASVEQSVADERFCLERLPSTASVTVVDDTDAIMTVESMPRGSVVPPGAAVEYEVRITSKVDDPYHLVAITNTLPAGFEYIEMMQGPQPEVQGARLVWRGIDLAGKATLALKFRALTSALYGSYVGRVEVHTPELPLISRESKPLNVVPLLQLTKVASTDSVPLGGTLTYTISLLNLRDVTVSGIRLTDTLPTDFRFKKMLSGPTPGVSLDQRQVSWLNLSVGARGGLLALSFEVAVDADAQLGVHYNEVVGSAIGHLVPGTDQTAPVTVVTSGGTPPEPTRTPGGPTPVGPTATATRVGPTPTPFVRVATLYLPFTSRGR